MDSNQNLNKILIYIIPGILILWSLYLLHLVGPFYLTHTDPEYPYLMNGLNCAILDFSKIGHIDHPGTPFQVLTGIFIRITYWIAGHGGIVDDVITRPEFYLSWSSFYLTIITASVIFWLGKIVIRNGNGLFESIILQSVVFLSAVLIDLPSRYIPDRLMAILVFVLTGLLFKHLYQENYSGKKFVFQSGIVMALGFVTKINFLPMVLIPFILATKAKERIYYVVTFVIASVILFLPVYDKFSYFTGFVETIITHDGLYGGGSEQVFNMANFWNNVLNIFRYDIFYSLVVALSVVLIVFLFFKASIRKTRFKEFLFLVSFIIVSAGAILMIAKHYKNYYVIPIVSLSAITYLIIVKISDSIFKFRYLKMIFGLVLVVMIIIPVTQLYPGYSRLKKKNHQNFVTSNFIKYQIPSSDYFFIEPTWMHGPMVTNGLVYGMSYVNHHNYYYNDFEKYYPNIITWEGITRPVSYFRMLPADNNSVFKSGKDIYVLSTPGRYAHVLCNYVDSCAAHYNVILLRDTVFQNSEKKEFIIRYKHDDTWKTIINSSCGFEKIRNDQVYTDDEQNALIGSFAFSEDEICNGLYSLKLDNINPRSPVFEISNAIEGDYIEVTVKRRASRLDPKGNLYIEVHPPDTSKYILAKGHYLTLVSDYWEIMRVNTEIGQIPAGSTIHCYYEYPGDEAEFVDDFLVRYFSPH